MSEETKAELWAVVIKNSVPGAIFAFAIFLSYLFLDKHAGKWLENQAATIDNDTAQIELLQDAMKQRLDLDRELVNTMAEILREVQKGRD